MVQLDLNLQLQDRGTSRALNALRAAAQSVDKQFAALNSRFATNNNLNSRVAQRIIEITREQRKQIRALTELNKLSAQSTSEHQRVASASRLELTVLRQLTTALNANTTARRANTSATQQGATATQSAAARPASGGGISAAGEFGVPGAIGAAVVGGGLALQGAGLTVERARARALSIRPDLSQQELRQIATEVVNIARDVPFSQADIYQGLADVFLAGIRDVGQALSLTRAGAGLSFLEQAPLRTGTGLAITLGQVYNRRGYSTERILDIVAAARASGRIDVNSLQQFIGTAVSTGASTGVSLEELLATQAALTLQGIRPEQSATYARQIYASLLRPQTRVARAVREQFGQSAPELIRGGRTGIGILQELRQTLGEEQFFQLFARVQALQVATVTTGEGYENFQRILDDTTNSSGKFGTSLNRITDTQFFGLDRELSKAQTSFQTIGDTLNQNLLPAIIGLAMAANYVLNFVAENTQGNGLGSIALSAGATGTVFTAGGVALRRGSGFLGRFTGREARLLQRIPGAGTIFTGAAIAGGGVDLLTGAPDDTSRISRITNVNIAELNAQQPIDTPEAAEQITSTFADNIAVSEAGR